METYQGLLLEKRINNRGLSELIKLMSREHSLRIQCITACARHNVRQSVFSALAPPP